MLLLESCFQVTPALQDNAQNTVHLEFNYMVSVASVRDLFTHAGRNESSGVTGLASYPARPARSSPKKIYILSSKIISKKIVIFRKYVPTF